MFNAKLRNQIRKAKKSGLQFVVGHLEILDGFYAVFARNMRDLGTPVQSKSFFRNILEVFPDTTRIFAVYHQTRMIAAGIGSWFKDTFEVPWGCIACTTLLAIPDRWSEQHTDLTPTNLRYQTAIRIWQCLCG